MLYSNIKVLCKKKKITIMSLEKALGFSKGSMSRWRINSPSVAKVKKVADFLNVSIDDLVTGGEEQVSEKELGEKIKEYLEDNNITQIALSNKVGIDISKLNMILNGKRRIYIEDYAAICWALDVNIDEFLNLKPCKPVWLT